MPVSPTRDRWTTVRMEQAAEQRSARGAPATGVGVGANARRGYQTKIESRFGKLIGHEAGFHAAWRDE